MQIEDVFVHRIYPTVPFMWNARSSTTESEQRLPVAGRGAAKGREASSELVDTSRPHCGGNVLGANANLP